MTAQVVQDYETIAEGQTSEDFIALPASTRHGRRQMDAYALYLQDITRSKLLTQDEELELAAKVQQGNDEARSRMIECNLRLVVKIARTYEHYGLPLLDLIN